MSALEEYLRSRRTRRFPLDETLPDGTPAAQVLLPSVLRMPTEGVEIPEAAPTLQPPPALRARRVFTPPEFGPVEESAAVSPIVAPEGVDYQPGTLAARRRWSSPFNQETERNTAMREVLTDPSQLPKAGRLQRWVVTPLLRAAQGLSATGNAAGGGGGLVAGLVEAAVDPQAATRLQYQRRLGESDANLGRMSAQRQAQLKQAGELADLDYTRARTRDLLNPKPKEPKLFQGADGLQYEYDPTSGEARAIPGQGNRSSQPKVLRTVSRGGKVWYETEEGLRPALDPTSGEQLAEPMREITVGGQTFNVSESEAARILGGIDAADTASRNQYGNQSYEDAVRQIDRGNSDAKGRYEAARQMVNQLSAARKEAEAKYALVNNPPPHRAGGQVYGAEPEEVARYQQEYKAAQQAYLALKGTIQQNYPDLVQEVREGGLALKSQPAPKPYPQRPAPQRRGAAAAPRPRTPPVAEEDFVNAARKRLGAGFDEGKAREAYRRRYNR